ncbi:MAG: class I SAM-dependent methyltransferase [Caulobacterales bacterium]|nr:class I SAM-dependent methyltransferase [Caulobacterales bacterium]
MLKPSVLAVAAALVLSACGSVAGPSPQLAGVYDTVVADPRRPADEVARDPFRHPADMLAFARIEPGDKVADIRPGAGYFTRLFAPVVGDTGKVYAFVPNRTAERENPRADALVAAYPNVVRVNGDLNTLSFPEPLDVVWMSQEYHDFHIPAFNTDVALMNRAIFDALKPGGLFVVVDHSGRPGTGHTEVQTLHRIEGASLRAEVEAAGFVFDGETTVLANPADDRTVNVFDEAIRGRTDQFVYRFRKPG